MALEELRGYLAVAGGLTEMTRAKAVAQAKAILADDAVAPLVAGGAKAQSQVQALAEEILAAGRANRELVAHLVKAEVEKVAGSLGALGREDIKALRVSLDRLERRVAVVEAQNASVIAAKRTKKAAAKKAPARKAGAKKAAAKKATASKAPASPTALRATATVTASETATDTP